jgi:hypothetical protein
VRRPIPGDAERHYWKLPRPLFYDRSRNRWAGTITVGWKPDGRRDRIIVRGKTKTEVKDKLRTKHQELAAGIRAPAGTPSSSA